MNIKVTTTKVIADNLKVNRGEYRVTELLFDFSSEYEALTKVAVYTMGSQSYEMNIVDNKSHIPYDVLKKVGKFTLGVYGYEKNNGELTLRYSPTPAVVSVIPGSYTQDATPAEDTSNDRYLTPNNLIAGDNIFLEKDGNNVTIVGTGGGGGGGTTNYHYLSNKPQINGVELDGNKTSEELGITGTEYEAGSGIAIEENSISVDITVARKSDIDYLSRRISAQDNRIEQQNLNISNIDTELDTFKEDYLIDMGGIVEEINNRYTKTEVDNLIPDMSNYYNKTQIDETLNTYYDKTETNLLLEDKQDELVSGTNVKTINNQSILGNGNLNITTDLSNYYTKTETDNVLNNKASLSIDYGNDEVTVSQGSNSFSLSPNTSGYELDISGSVVATLASKNYVDSKLSPTEEMIVGWNRITPNTYHEVDLRTALANGKKRFTILIYMRKGENRQATKYELTITELEKLFTKVKANELVITRTITGISNTNVVAMLKQFVKQTYDENNQVIPGLLQIKYQGYENNAVIGTFDNFEYTMYGE